MASGSGQRHSLVTARIQRERDDLEEDFLDSGPPIPGTWGESVPKTSTIGAQRAASLKKGDIHEKSTLPGGRDVLPPILRRGEFSQTTYSHIVRFRWTTKCPRFSEKSTVY